MDQTKIPTELKNGSVGFIVLSEEGTKNNYSYGSGCSCNRILRPALFVVQVMSDVSKQDCIHNKRVPQCTKTRFSIINDSNDEQKSPTYPHIN